MGDVHPLAPARSCVTILEENLSIEISQDEVCIPSKTSLQYSKECLTGLRNRSVVGTRLSNSLGRK